MRAMAAAERPAPTVPRGRHAPPLEVRLSVQRRRLFEAAADVFARVGYADASAEAISREAGMSKATFYEHFANKEECILALFDEAATEVMRAMSAASDDEGHASYEERVPPACAPSWRRWPPIRPRRRRCWCRSSAPGPRRGAARRDPRCLRRVAVPRQPARRAAVRRAHLRLARRRLRGHRRLGRARLAQPAHRPAGGRGRARAGDHAADAGRAPARVTAGERRRAAASRASSSRSSPAGAARGSWRGASRWRARSGRRSPARSTGAPAPGLRRSGCARARPRPGARRPRRQPHRARVHGRPLGRLALRRHVPRRPRQPADLGAPRRRPASEGRVDHGRGALRAAGQQAHAPGARRVPALVGGRARAPRATCGSSSAWAPSPGTPRCACAPRSAIRAQAAAAVRPRGGLRRRRLAHARRLLSPQPAEHVHRQAHRAHARRGLPACARARRGKADADAARRFPDRRARPHSLLPGLGLGRRLQALRRPSVPGDPRPRHVRRHGDGWNTIAPAARERASASGRSTTATRGTRRDRPLRRPARRLPRQVQREDRRGQGVDVGHSQGGSLARYVAVRRGAARRGRRRRRPRALEPRHDQPLAGPAGVFGCPACAEQEAGSAVHAEGQPAAARGARPGLGYTMVSTTHDEVVTPYRSQALAGDR